MPEIKRGRHSVYAINYHLVWILKCRKKILTGEIERRCEELLRRLCAEKGWMVISLKVMPDHVHLSLSVQPSIPVSRIVQTLKRKTATALFRGFPELRSVLRRGHLWAPSYYAGSTGNVSAEAIQRYIENTQRL